MFLAHRLGKLALPLLKSSVSDFYSYEDLVEAKKQLMKDINDMRSLIDFPHVPERREGEARALRVMDDIITILTCLDENLQLQSLPKYVSDGPDSMPSTRLYDGDLVSLMNYVGKMNNRLTEIGSSVVAIANEVLAIKQQTEALSTVNAPVRPRRVDGIGRGASVDLASDQFVAMSTGGNASVSGMSTADVTDNQQQAGSYSDTTQPRTSWAAMATSSPLVTGNRYAALDSVADGEGDDRFSEYVSRRSAKRRRQQSATQQQQQQQRRRQQAVQSASSQQQSQALNDRTRRQSQSRPSRVLTGKAVPSSPSSAQHRTLYAAKKFVKKAVFCVDNVDSSCDVGGLTAFVRGLSVNVLSCFETKPRRRRGETGPVRDRKAFRLCIAEEDCTRLLDASKWPDSIVISEWFYVSPDNYQRLVPQGIVNEDGGQTLNTGEARMQESRSDIQDTTLTYYDDGTASAGTSSTTEDGDC